MSLRPPYINDVGSLWLDREGEVWELITYCAEPSCSWRKVADPDVQVVAAVRSKIAQEFVRLVAEPRDPVAAEMLLNCHRPLHLALGAKPRGGE